MKSLRAFKRIKDMYKYFVKKSRDLEPTLMICEKEDFNLVEKSLKALEIIKKKWVNVDLLIRSNYLDVYNMQMRVYSPIHKFQELTQEEYDLLKEVLL